MGQGMMGRLMTERRTDGRTNKQKERKKDGWTDVLRALSSHGYSTLPQSIVMTFLVRECYGSPKKQEFLKNL